MKIVITDSGLGGLSVAAELYERLKSNDIFGVEVIFANALLESGKGYNKMPDKATKVQVFNSVLEGFNNYFQPDMISVACNTLSVLLEETKFATQFPELISDVVSTGIEGFTKSNKIAKDDNMIIFGTETTIGSGVHAKEFAKVFDDRICAIACSGLAGAIERNFQSQETFDIITQAVEKITCKSTTSKNYAYLACTHYGYVSDLFEKIMEDKGFEKICIADPNIFLVEYLYDLIQSQKLSENDNPSEISVISRCKILDSEVQSISQLIETVSKDTVDALQNYKILEDLF